MHAKVPVFILAGGKSSRFGSDKARALVGGKPLISSLAERLRPYATSLTVVADVAKKYADLGLETIADTLPGLGPIGGLHAALQNLQKAGAKEKWFLLLSCDAVGFDPTWIAELLAQRTRDLRAVAFKSERWEPLIALYHQSIRADVDKAISADDRSMWKLLESVSARAVPLPEHWTGAVQVNTQQELADFLKNRRSIPERRQLKDMAASKKKAKSPAGKVPGTFKDFITKFPALGRAHEQVAKAVESAGPIDAKTCALIKIGICVGAGLESATRSHVRRAMEHGATEQEIEQAILLAMNTVGFPKTVAAWSWARVQFERGV